ncbi:MAG: M48 family metallopeptidase [Pseudomonadota bacterium]
MTDEEKTREDARGWCYSAGTSHRVQGVVLQRGAWLRVMSEDRALLAEAPVEDIELDKRLGDLPRKLTFPDGTVFETEDHAFVLSLDANKPAGFLHELERFHPRLIAFVLAGVLGVWLIYRFVLEGFVGVAVFMTPQTLVDGMDQGTLQALDVSLLRPTTLSQTEKADAQAIFADLLAALPDDERDRDFSLQFRQMRGSKPNALALPGGTIILTDSLAKGFDRDVVAGVLGHEIGHVVEDHALRRLYRSLGIFVLISLVAGETGPILEDIVLEGNVLLSLRYSRDQEAEADRFGLRLSDAAGYDPAGLVTFFEALSQRSGGGTGAEWLSTHPAHETRISEIEALIEAN